MAVEHSGLREDQRPVDRGSWLSDSVGLVSDARLKASKIVNGGLASGNRGKRDSAKVQVHEKRRKCMVENYSVRAAITFPFRGRYGLLLFVHGNKLRDPAEAVH